MGLDPSQNPDGIGSFPGDKRRLTDAQRLQTLQAQLDDPARDPGSTAELQGEIARLQGAAAVAQPKLVRFQGQVHQFPAEFTDEHIRQALASLAPQASQADVRAAEPQPGPMESQKEKEARFADAMQRYVKETGGTIPPGKNIRQAAEEWSGIQDPVKTRGQAETAEVGAGGDVQYGDSVPYVASKALAALGGFAAGGPAGATASEAAVRFTSLAFNLQKAVSAGAIDEDRAAEIMAKEMLKGTSEDALFNVGLPLLGQIVMKIPGAKWLADKVAARIGATGPTANEAAQRTRAVDKLAKSAPTPAAQSAVQQLSGRTQGVIPTPGQVTGEASVAEQAARVVNPGKFDRASAQLSDAASGMREDLVNPATQPVRKELGQQILDTAEGVERAIKDRLRPAFQAADNADVTVDFSPVLVRAKSALAKALAVPGKTLRPEERAALEETIKDIEAQPAVRAGPALDFISRQKEKLREATAVGGKPSREYQIVQNDLQEAADEAYMSAAAGKGDITANLIAARKDYREMMDTIYKGSIKAALRKELTPEDIPGQIWSPGNVSEPEQLQRLMQLATRERVLSASGANKMTGDMVRGFLQQTVPDVAGAAKWSESLAANPKLRDTWLTLTSTPGGSQLRGTMEVLEQAAKIAQREHKDLVGDLGLAAIPLSRAAGGGWGVSLVTGAFHPLIGAAGISVDVVMRMAATAYTQGNKGVLNATMRALRANSAGTAASAKILQETLPKLREYAQANNLGDLYVQARDAAAQTQQ